MSNVINAFGRAVPGERKKRAEEILHEVLGMVATRPITGLMVIIVENNATESQYTCDSWLELLGAIRRAEHHIQKDLDSDG